jgi:hypothetical protein
LLNFHYDPVACAVALGWSGATVESRYLTPIVVDDVLRFQPGDPGREIRVTVDVDGPAFSEVWIAAVEAAQRT